MQPERDLRQFHGHRILVHAMDDTLQDHAAHDMAVVELGFIHRPSLRFRGRENPAADVTDSDLGHLHR